MRRVVVVAGPELWQTGHGPDHPLKPARLLRTYELMDELGLLSAPNVSRVTPRPASDEELRLFHTAEYVAAVRRLSEAVGRGEPASAGDARRHNFGPGDNPVFAGMYELHAVAVGASLQAAALLEAGECDTAFSFGGGLHHAAPDHASGFCVFNDPAVAITWLRRRGRRVAYIDVDVHHGDGVQYAFDDDPQVLTISLHQDGRSLFPGTGFVYETGSGPGEGASFNVPFPAGTDDETYLWAFDQVVPPAVDRFAPDIVVTQLGVDTHASDPLAGLMLTSHGHEAVFRRLAALAPRWLALGGGGYNIEVVPRAWTMALAVMAEIDLPEDLPARYRERYGGRRLHDESVPRLDPDLRREVRRIVEHTVEDVKQRHHLA
jgi:acetoin utilization protein AcuC